MQAAERIPMKIRPLHDRAVIRRAQGYLKSKGGIITRDIAKEKPQEGEVIAGCRGTRNECGKLIPLDATFGDRILLGKRSGTDFRIDGEAPLIKNEPDIMDVVEKTVAAKKAAWPSISDRNLKTELDEHNVCQGNQILH